MDREYIYKTNKGMEFGEQMLDRCDTLKSRLKDSNKGLHILYSYFSTISKELHNFLQILTKASKLLEDFIQLSKDNENSLTNAIKSVIHNQSELYTFIEIMHKKQQNEVIDPFKDLITQYEDLNKSVLNERAQIILDAEKSKEQVLKVREEYHKWAKNYFHPGETSLVLLKLKMEEAKVQYQKEIEKHNSLIKNLSIKHLEELKKIEQNEMKRAGLIVSNICRFMSINEKIIAKYKTYYEKASEDLEKVDPKRDIKEYTANISITLKGNTFSKIVYEDFGEIYQHINKLNVNKFEDKKYFETSSAASISRQDKVEEEKIKKVCNELLEGKNMCKDVKAQVMNSFATAYGRHWFIEVLSEVEDKLEIKDHAAFETLGQLISNLLNFIISEDDMRLELVWIALKVSFLIYIKETSPQGLTKKTFLKTLIVKHGIWKLRAQCTKLWINIIQKELVYIAEKKGIELTPNNKKKQTTETLREENMRTLQISATLNSIGRKMIIMGVARQIGKELLLRFSGYYEIPTKKICDLLLEYEGLQSVSRNKNLNKEEIKKVIERNVKHSLDKYEGLFVIGKSLPYANEFKTLRNVLLLNKLAYKVLKRRVYKKALTFPNLSIKTRSSIWQHSILDKTLIKKYEEIKAKELQQFIKKKKTSEEVLNLDIERSFHIHDEKSREVNPLTLP